MTTNEPETGASGSRPGTTRPRTATTADGIPGRLVNGPPGEQIEMGGETRRFSRDADRSGLTVSALLMRLAFAGAVVTCLLAVAGLGWNLTREGHAIAAEPSPQSEPENHPANPLRMGPASTGVAAVDDALRGFLDGDVDAAFSQMVVQQVSCGTLPSGGTPGLTCLAAELPGTVHEMILSACEPKWVTAEAARKEVASLLADIPGLNSVTRGNGGYSVVLSWPDAPDRSLVLTISPAGITSYRSGCALATNPGVRP